MAKARKTAASTRDSAARLERMTAADTAAAAPASASLLGGNKFYLSWSIPAERRRELRALIQNNGGIALKSLAPDAVELVESEALQVGKDWVSVDFVYDSVRDQMMRELTQYMAPNRQAAVVQNRPAMTVDEPKRKGRVKYTVTDNAKMLQFLENYQGIVKSMESVPLNIWKMAERINVTDHSSESMHEHYRKILKKYTPQERRNVLQHAQAEENTRQRRELAALNGKAASKRAPTQSAAATAAASPVDSTSEPAAAAMSTTDDHRETRSASEVEASAEPEALDTNTASSSVTKRSAPVAADDETEQEDEEIQGHGKKRGRKSQSAEQQKAAEVEDNSTETSREEAVADTNESQEQPVTTAVAEVAGQFEQPASEPATFDSSENTPVVLSKKQQKQNLKREKAAAQSEAPPEERQEPSSQPTSVADAEEISSSPSSPSSERGGSGMIFFTSRWEQLISDTSNRQHLQQFFTLSRQRDDSAVAPQTAAATRGRTLRKATPTVPAIASTLSKAITTLKSNSTNNGNTTGSSAAITTRGRKRAMPAADEERKQEEDDEEEEDVAAKPAASKKRKARQTSQQQTAAGTPVAASSANSLSQVAPRQAPIQTTPRDERQEVLVTSETEVDELTCQLQFQTNQELNAVVHALYYSSGDVELALRFLRGTSVSEDFWSLEDDLLLGDDLVSDATDARKVADARRQGAFAAMRVQRTTAQILTRIRYLS